MTSSGGSAWLLLLPAHVVERDVAPDQDEPGGGIARRAVLRPGLERAQAGLLERLLGAVEVAEIAQQRADRLGTRGGQRRIDPGDVGHCARQLPAVEQLERPDLEAPPVSSRPICARDVDRLVEGRAVDDVEAEQLLLGLGEGAVDDERLASRADGGRRRRRHQAHRRAELAVGPQLVGHHRALGEDRVVLLLGPGS